MELFSTYPFIDARLAVAKVCPRMRVAYGSADIMGRLNLVVRLMKGDHVFDMFYSDDEMEDLTYVDYIEEIHNSAQFLEQEIKKGDF